MAWMDTLLPKQRLAFATVASAVAILVLVGLQIRDTTEPGPRVASVETPDRTVGFAFGTAGEGMREAVLPLGQDLKRALIAHGNRAHGNGEGQETRAALLALLAKAPYRLDPGKVTGVEIKRGLWVKLTTVEPAQVVARLHGDGLLVFTDRTGTVK